ncbi:hypothetical protein U6A24_03670 [Aquimarina gracilis]|uniref:Secreted protein (Por secretion system target) n=1 Tax=Aquimarina gracilis TaxID=874422 RepID=A0ABU5ZRK0_9FLAO|nr:hypothetical protein [Aquimarina gracilis]MEB3344543.1 hypothetical protein [Aquimarina gracilis]
MKAVIYILSLFLSLSMYANDDTLTVEKDGLIVEVVDFQEGDKLKLFEVETGDHILSKTRAQIDLSQLPVGAYLLENNQGKSVVINRLEEDLKVDGAIDAIHNEFLLERDSQRAYMDADIDVEEEYANYYENAETDLLAIEREGDIITVLYFEEGDKIKLFEVKNTVHILSKTTNFVDMSQLPAGVYVLENNKGESVVVEKYENVEVEDNLVADM